MQVDYSNVSLGSVKSELEKITEREIKLDKAYREVMAAQVNPFDEVDFGARLEILYNRLCEYKDSAARKDAVTLYHMITELQIQYDKMRHGRNGAIRELLRCNIDKISFARLR